MREYYVLKSQSHNPDTPTYIKNSSGETAEEHFKAMDDEIKRIMKRNIWKIVSRKSVAYHNVIPGTCSFKCNKKPDWTISKLKARYCVRGDFQKKTVS